MTTHRDFEISPLCLDAYFVNTYTNQKLLINRRTRVSSVKDAGNDAGEQESSVIEDQPDID